MQKKIIMMFSGQGSQYYHMGKELYECHPRFRLWMEHCDEIARPLMQTSLVGILYQGKKKSDPFDQIRYTNPALLCVQYSLAQVLMEMGVQPDFLLGYSLGEIAASVVAKILSLEQGLRLVIDMATLVETRTPRAGMLAIIESPEIMFTRAELFQNCWLTGINFNKNFVVCGLEDNIEFLQAGLKRMNIACQQLPVQYGFHTKLIDPVQASFTQIARAMALSPANCPIISAHETNIVRGVTGDYFWNVIRSQVNFEKTIRQTLNSGDFIFIDVGPSGSLATFVKYILPTKTESVFYPILNPFGKDMSAIEKLNAALSNGDLNGR